MTNTALSEEAQAARESDGRFGVHAIRPHEDGVGAALTISDADLIRKSHSWATDEQVERIIAGTPETTSAAVARISVPGYDDEDDHSCKHCGERVVTGMDGVRGRLGHAGTEDTACRGAERSAAVAYALRVSARHYVVTNPTEARRLLDASDAYDREAEMLAGR